MTIRMRVIGGFSLLLMLLVIVAGLGIVSESILSKNSNQILTEDVAIGREATEIKYLLTLMRQKEKGVFIAISGVGDETPANKKKEFDETVAQLTEHITLFGRLNLNTNLRRQHEKMDDQLKIYLDAVNAIFAQIENSQISSALEADAQLIPYKKAIYELRDAVENAAKDAENDAKIAAQAMAQTSQNIHTLLLTLALIAILTGIGLAIWLGRSILRPIALIRSEVTLIGQNLDLTRRIQYQQPDEIGETAQAINQMLATLGSTLQQIQHRAIVLKSWGQELAQASNTVREGSAQQTQMANNLASSLVLITDNVAQVSTLSLDAQQLSIESGQAAQAGVAHIETMMQDISQIADSIGLAAQAAEELDASSDQISSITAVIKDVAEQTNLLALNAAIEAARAGEQGRGFAVVADEVRKLAEKTGQSAQEITTMIAAIQHNAKSMAQQMRESVTHVEGGKQVAHTAGESIQAISSRTRQVVERIDEVSQALNEQTSSSQQVSGEVRHMSHTIAENAQVMFGVASTAQQLDQLADAMQAEVQKFKVPH